MADEAPERENEEEYPARIARPGQPLIPPVNLRAVGGDTGGPAPAMSERTPIGGSSTIPPAMAVKPAIPRGMTPETQGRIGQEETELNRLQTTGSGISQIKNKGGRGILKVLDTIGSIALPGVMRRIPGTELHHQMLEGQQRARLAQDVGTQEKEAQAAEAQARVPNIEAETELHKAQAEAAKNPKPEKPENIQQLYADAVAEALGKGTDPNQDPKVKQLADTITSLQKQPVSKEPNRDDRAISIMSKPKEQWTPEEQAYMRGYDQFIQKNKIAPQQIRVEGMANMREYPVINKKTGELEMRSATDINKNPGTYAPAGAGGKAMGQTALIEDIRGNIQQVRSSLQNEKMPEFSAAQRAEIAVSLGGKEPTTALSAALRGGVLGNLTPEQQEYLINLAQLKENAMAMRAVLGAGQGSEDMRAAINATIPGPRTPSKAYGLQQLDKFEKVLNRLERGIPGMPLKPEGGAQAGPPTGGGNWNPKTGRYE